ncbi:enterobactin synthase subunit EntD [Citrobacter sp. 50677481]|uniref:enterobactin synthase subunit EntD n=1 Tax=Citrobacter sp. 50677481 TaxID=1736699 RepID=UPI000741CA5E|nr:enterobactin synthase subunit EntD [Citrobacter sp. 50677481]KSY33506.1 hypothetical protein APU02_00830 [Citrobacter sp. 50677481]HCQ7755751.1 enterobactin synthase subunit EntD [Citrobacter sedlakii]
MQITHSRLPFADLTLHVVTFDPASFQESDLLWLPHYTRLMNAGRKRKSEHLAGRIAAVHALREYGVKSVPGIGDRRQPLWPEGLFGSISHCGNTALAVVAREPVGVDTEALFSPQTAEELVRSLVSEAEQERLKACRLPFEQALTLAFSAKESAFKATPASEQHHAGFHHYEIVDVQADLLRLRHRALRWRVQWHFTQQHLITLARG